MPKKLKFKPEIKRVKLNPEQAVLQCDCFDGYWVEDSSSPAGGSRYVCRPGAKTKANRLNYSMSSANT